MTLSPELFAAYKTHKIEHAFQSWISSLVETTGCDVIAIDGKTVRRSFSINQQILPCEVYTDLFTIDNLSKLESDMEFRSVIINKFITRLNSGVEKSQSDLYRKKLSQKVTSLRGDLQ